jgi:oxygen-independent coproporphyrinogen-3 oxidase
MSAELSGELMVGWPLAAYVHIPFCRRRCFYCDFPISVVGDRPPLSQPDGSRQFGSIAAYVEVLQQEIQAVRAAMRTGCPSNPASIDPASIDPASIDPASIDPASINSTSPHRSLNSSLRAAHPPLQTVFFGGGTPSLLTVNQLDQILQQLDRSFGIAADAEISMEIDPGTFDRERLQGYRSAGINRVSLGVQAFQTHLLQACGRTHTRSDIEQAVRLIEQVGLTNFSLDLISGLPHQTLEDWQASLTAAIQLAPPHLSIYDLTVEAGTAFDRWYQAGVQPLPTDQQTATMYRMAQQSLTAAGYQHYEVSNYAQPGFQCRHNRVYWQNQPYYGFGMGAASYVQHQRFTRPRKRSDYYDWVQAFQTSGQIDCPVTPAAEQLLDTLMLGLRLAEGLNIGTLIDRFGFATVQQLLLVLEPYVAKGWVIFRDPTQELPASIDRLETLGLARLEHRSIALSDPEGFLFSNQVLADLFEQFDLSSLI